MGQFEAIYRANVASITRYFARRTRDPLSVADLTHDTFVEAIYSFHTFDPAKGSSTPWLFGIARHVYAQHRERAIREQDAAMRNAGQRALELDEIDDLLSRIDSATRGRQALARLEALPAADREVIELVDLEGLTPKEAALALGVSSGLLRVRLFRAHARLRREWQSDV